MSENDKQYEKQFGLDTPMNEALATFSKLTKQELEAEGNIPPVVADGELELIAFKGAAIRRVCHNDEWWYSIVDIVGALVGTDRASKYWNDVKTKLTDEEGFFELSDFIGKLPLPGADGKRRPSEVATPETLDYSPIRWCQLGISIRRSSGLLGRRLWHRWPARGRSGDRIGSCAGRAHIVYSLKSHRGMTLSP